MRILGLVSCGRKASLRPHQEIPAANPPPGRSATTAAAAAVPHDRRRCRAAGTPHSGAAQHWRPTLGAISEDGVLRSEANPQEKGGRPRSAAQVGKAKAVASARTYGWDYRNDSRRFTAPAVFPAFAPSAFLF